LICAKFLFSGISYQVLRDTIRKGGDLVKTKLGE
jgi:hypothetical protein